MAVTIYHNPGCSKSRETLALLRARGVDPEIVLYLGNPPSKDVLKSLVKKLGLASVRDLMRSKEELYTELNLAKVTSENALIEAMVKNPVLIERPIVVNSEKAAIGRPPEKALCVI